MALKIPLVDLWRLTILIITPIILLPLVFVGTKEALCGFTVMVMAVYWLTEVIPLVVTALIPVFAFPLSGILSTEEVCVQYLKDTIMLFMGGLMVAVTVEHCGLHRRIALNILFRVGTSVRWLLFGFMLTTSVLSMWISNTATTAMSVPLVEAVIMELAKQNSQAPENTEESGHQDGIEMNEVKPQDDSQATTGHQDGLEMNEMKSQDDSSATSGYQHGLEMNEVKPQDDSQSTSSHQDDSEMNEVKPQDDSQAKPGHERNWSPAEIHKLRRCFLLSIAYSASIGGTGSLYGTPPNLVLKHKLYQSYGDEPGITFLMWMVYNIPGMLINLLLTWLWLQYLFLGLRGGKTTRNTQKLIREIMKEHLREMGSINFHQAAVSVSFVIVVLLWLFRKARFISGWADYLPIAVDDATPAILVVFLLLCIPSKIPNFNSTEQESSSRYETLITWDVIQKKLPWNIILLIGGGFALAEAVKQSGLSLWVSQQIKHLEVLLPSPVIVVVLCIVTAMFTEITSNTATSAMILPVLKDVSEELRLHPLYLMLPATITCSYAFMLPVATPPNAIVYHAGHMRIIDMAKPGFVVNLICVTVTIIMINTYGKHMFHLDSYPEWALQDKTIENGNVTDVSACNVTTINGT